MKKLTIKVLITLALMFSITYGLNAQFLNGFYNGSMPIQHTLIPNTNPFRGYLIPNTTQWDGPNYSDTNAYFPILIVFVQFADDDYVAPHGSWPLGQAPIYLDSMIATEKNMNSSIPWWEKYDPNTQMISSQWMEISRGKFHVISPSPTGIGAFSVILGNASEYADPITGENYMNQVIWQKLWEQGLRDWTPYDKWSYNTADSLFYNEGDGKVDFIYKIHRSRGRGAMPNNDGYAALSSKGGYGLVDTVHNIIADYGLSGFTLSFRGLESQYIAAAGHEHVHFMTAMKHIQNSRIAYGIGLDFFFSPYDMILNEYMTPTNASFGQTNYLDDYSSRNTGTGEIIKVPISGNECFLLANRNKVSKWDRVMMGDSAQIEPYKDNSELGKGLYIYHLKNGVHFPESINDTVQDLECADGYWKWKLVSTEGIAKLPYDCFTSGQDWHVFQKDSVLYSNDPSTLGDLRPPYYNSNYGNPLPYGDDLSFFHRLNNDTWTNRWTTGQFTNQNCGLNVERTFTNDIDIVDNGNLAGDRYDAWKPGYNEVFSPYSSPSTKKWNNVESGIFIYFDTLNGTNANIKIYKVGENYMTEDDILAATPPSKPMGIKIDRTDCINKVRYPVITWNHNMEPDMLEYSLNPVYKRYKIFRAHCDLSNVPENYYEIADISIHKDSIPTYIDYNAFGSCEENSVSTNDYRLRYKIKAVDNTAWASVYSDFVSIVTRYLNKGEGDSMAPLTETPKSYQLSQNYPNPFNPVTKINFALPKQGFVTLKIYDIIGREIKTLVNEVKQAGNYTVDFNGSSLSSGVYFYKIQSGVFVSVKRMVLIK